MPSIRRRRREKTEKAKEEEKVLGNFSHNLAMYRSTSCADKRPKGVNNWVNRGVFREPQGWFFYSWVHTFECKKSVLGSIPNHWAIFIQHEINSLGQNFKSNFPCADWFTVKVDRHLDLRFPFNPRHPVSPHVITISPIPH
jgi:hypothetical protein